MTPGTRDAALAPVLGPALALALAFACDARAQDFAPAAPSGPCAGALALLERALPYGPAARAAEVGATRWLALSELETRAAALALPVAGARVALGVSQTGEPSLGWTSVALAAGAADAAGGAAVRGVARLDRAEGDWAGARLARAGGLEAGAGAWLAAARALVVWVSAPQLALAGAAPPLLRPAEMGLRAGGGDAGAWLALVAPRRGDDGERVAGIALGGPPISTWAEVRDGPLRASLGVRAMVRGVTVEARVDAHPVLGETTRVQVGWRGRGRQR